MKPAVAAKPPRAKGAAGPTKRSRSGSECARGATPDAETKQARVIAMLRRPEGATVAAIADATGWQPHSVRAFLARVVRRRLGLHLVSDEDDGGRVYRIRNGAARKSGKAR